MWALDSFERKNKLALSKKIYNLHSKYQRSSFYSFRDLSAHTDGQTDMASLTPYTL